ncbi:MAG: S9 family peptidase [archaeon GB-1867-005]|nr:S9 family peptidase [Candidatus Culexmicrobium cathedralense]
MRKLELKDLNKIISVVDPQISPSGDLIAFVTIRVDEVKDDYIMNIWVIDRITGEVRLTTSGDKDYWPRWSPDGRQLLFLSKRTLREGNKGNELWVLSISGGEPRLVLKREEGIESPQWSSDGRSIMFISKVFDEQHDEEVHAINRIPIWFDGIGYTHHFRKHLFIVDSLSSEVRQITSGDFDVVSATFSNKGDEIAYAAKIDDMKPLENYIYIASVNGGEARKITGKGMRIGTLNWSPDDEYVVFRASDLHRGYATHETIWIASRDGDYIENLTGKLDRGSSKRVYYDVRGPIRVDQPPIWIGDYIYFPLSSEGRINVYKLKLTEKKIEPVIVGDFIIDNFTIENNAIAYTKITEVEPAEVWVKDERGDVKLTAFNDEWLKRVSLSKPERFEFIASDGVKIEGWIMKPVEMIPGKKYPTILNIHGGPKSAFGYSFMFENQILASNGYVVVYLNPRGSDGYSEEFADIRRHYGERDYKDLIEGIDYVISKYEFIDPDKLGVMGLSYGGFMTNWIVTQTNKFKAAVSLNGISSWIAEFGTADIGFHFVPDQIGDDYWSNMKGYIEKSPLAHAPKVETPLMIIHSLEDYRCWFDQALLFFTALKYLGKTVELVLFMKGGHVFSRSGKPSHRIKRLKHTLRWFNKHLKGEVQN